MYEHRLIAGFMYDSAIMAMYRDGWRLIGMIADPAYEREYYFERPVEDKFAKAVKGYNSRG